MTDNNKKYNKIIDYTYINTFPTIDTIREACKIAIDNDYYAFCIDSKYASTAKIFLENTNIKLCPMLSFPKGYKDIKELFKELNDMVNLNVDEVDITFDYKKIKKMSDFKQKSTQEYEEYHNKLYNEIRLITQYCHKSGIIVKLIIEIEELNYEDLNNFISIILLTGLDYVMTSTGYAKTPKSFDEKLDMVVFMRKLLPDFIKIKYSGGIRTREHIDLVLPYVDRIGTSSIII